MWRITYGILIVAMSAGTASARAENPLANIKIPTDAQALTQRQVSVEQLAY